MQHTHVDKKISSKSVLPKHEDEQEQALCPLPSLRTVTHPPSPRAGDFGGTIGREDKPLHQECADGYVVAPRLHVQGRFLEGGFVVEQEGEGESGREGEDEEELMQACTGHDDGDDDEHHVRKQEMGGYVIGTDGESDDDFIEECPVRQ
jgi:hypothetical protein